MSLPQLIHYLDHPELDILPLYQDYAQYLKLELLIE